MLTPPKDTPLTINLNGKKIVKRISRPMTSSGTRNPLFDPFSVEIETEKYDFSVPGANESKTVLENKCPKLQAFINSKTTRPQTPKISITKPIMQYEQDNHPFFNTSMITRRSVTPLRAIPTVLELQQETIEKEEAEVAFDDDPIAYFSKHKDGHGHKFIYLNFVRERSDPDFSPYDLVKTTASQLNPEYFIMSANGVTQICEDGSTSSIPLDRWANESSHFTSLRKLKFFALYYLWKPFIQWKVYIMNMRFETISKGIMNTPFFSNAGFAKTQQTIAMDFVDVHKKIFLGDVVRKYLLSFKPQSQFIISDFNDVSNENHKLLVELYTEYINMISKQFLDFDASVRDPKNIIVRDSDIKTFKRRNPNLGQLMVLEKKKAEKRIKRTAKVNEEVLRYANYLRSIDYYLLEELAQSIVSSFNLALSYFKQPQSAVFQVEVAFTNDGNIALVPSLNDLKETINTEFRTALSLVSSFPRLLILKELRPHIKQSISDFRSLISNGPNIFSTLEPYKEIPDSEAEIIKVIEKSYKEATEAVQIFKELYPIYEFEKSWKIEAFIKTSSGQPPLPLDYELVEKDGISDIDFEREPYIDLKAICVDADEFLRYEKKIADLIPCSVAGALYIESRLLRKKLEPIPREKFDFIFTKLKQLLSGKSTRIYQMLNSYKAKLQLLPPNLDQYIALCKTIERVKQIEVNIIAELKYADELYHTFVKYNVSVEGAKLLAGHSLRSVYQAFTLSLEGAVAVRDQNIKKFTDELVPQATRIEDKINAYIEMASKIPLSVELCNLEILNNTIENTKNKIQKLKPKVEKFTEYQKTLHVETTNFASMGKLEEIVGFAEKLYDCVGRWNQLDVSYIRNAFSLVDVDNMSDVIFTLENDVNELSLHAPVNASLIDDLTNKIKTVSPYLKQLKLLSTPEMQQRHWLQLFESCKLPNIYKPGMRLDELLVSGIMEFSSKIEEITDIAQREEKAEAEFNVIFKHWKNVNIPVLSNQPKCEDNLLIGDTSELLLNIENALITLERMVSLPFAQGIEENVTSLIKQLSEATLIINAWSIFQENWTFLRSLFNNENGKAIPHQLVSQYNTVRRKWTTVVGHVYKDFSLLAVCSMSNLYEVMNDCNKSLVTILSNLHNYALSRIKVFPRLFLLGTNDIITLAAVSDVESVKRITAHLFMRCSSLVISETNNIQRIKIKGIEAVDGKQLLFTKQINVQGTLEHWLQHVVEFSNQSVAESIAYAVTKVQSNLADWIYSVPLQITYLALLISFSSEVEECLNSSSPQKALSKYASTLESRKAELISSFALKLSPSERETNNFVIIVLGNQLSVLASLCETNTPKSTWELLPRTKYEQYDKKLTVLINGQSFLFENEFWGKFRPIIYTESVKRVISDVFTSDLPLIVGSTSTGRKTIIEHAAVLLGKLVYFCPAYSTISQLHLKQILNGCVMSGSWCVFKDVNALPSSALLTISDFIQTFKNATLLNQDSMTFDSITSNISPKARFIFLDEGNSAKLPDQLRSSLHRLVVSTPDLFSILNISLSAEGFKYHDTAASKLEHATKSIGQVLVMYLKTPAAFGNALRIVKIAGTMRSDSRESNQNFSLNSERLIEEFIVARAIYQFYGCLITSDVHPLLIKILYDVFRSHDSYDLFKTSITSSTKSKLDDILANLFTTAKNRLNTNECVKEYIAQRVVDLYNFLLYNRCVIIHGATNSGKDLVINTLVKSIGIMSASEPNNTNYQLNRFKVHHIYHSAHPWETIFGYPKNEGTQDEQWCNGLINMIFDSINNTKDDYVHLIVFDGLLTPKFNEFIVELAQGRIVRLHSLDSLDLGPNIKIIILADQLSSISPSMISCCAMMQMNSVGAFTRSARNIENCDFIKFKVFSKIIIDSIGDIFDALLRQISTYVMKFSDLSFNKLVPDSDSVCFLMQNLYPEFVARYIASLIDAGDIGINEKNITSAFVIASSRFFDGVLNPTISLQFNTWLQNTFSVDIDTDWDSQRIYSNFKLFVPRAIFAVFNPEYKENSLIDISAFDKVEQDEVFDPKTSIVAVPSILYNYETISTLIKGKNDVCLIGKEGETIIQYFVSKEQHNYKCYRFTVNANTSPSSLFNQIDIHTDIFNKKAQPNRKTVLIFENLDEGSLEIQELIREIILTKSVFQIPASTKALPKPILLKNTNFIITTKSVDSLEEKLITKFATVFSKPLTQEEVTYILKYIFLRCRVNPSFTNKAVDLINDMISSIPDCPQSIRSLIEMTYATLIFRDRKLENHADSNTMAMILFSEILLRLKTENREQIINLFQKHFPTFNVAQATDFSLNFPRVQYVAKEGEMPFTKCTMEETSNVLEETENYITQFNAASNEKAPLFISLKLLNSMMRIQRAITFPMSHAILVGKEGSGRFSSARIVANIAKYDFILLTESDMFPVMKEIIQAAVVYAKKYVAYLRSNTLGVTKQLQTLMTFATTGGFATFFSRKDLSDLYINTANTYKINPAAKQQIRDTIKKVVMNNVHVVISRDSGATPLNWDRAITVQFEEYEKEDLQEITQRVILTLSNKKIFGSFGALFPKLFATIHEVTRSFDNNVHHNNYFDFLRTFNDVIINKYNNAISLSSTKKRAVAFLDYTNDEFRKLEKTINTLKQPLENSRMELDILEKSYKAKLDAVRTMDNKVSTQKYVKEQNLHELENTYLVLKDQAKEAKTKIEIAEKEVAALNERDIATIRISAEDPSYSFKKTFELLCMFLGWQFSYEVGGVKLIADPNFLTILHGGIQYENLQQGIINKADEFLKDPNFTLERVEQTSPPVVSIYNLVCAIEEYAKAQKAYMVAYTQYINFERAYGEFLNEINSQEASINHIRGTIDSDRQKLEEETATFKKQEEDFNVLLERKEKCEHVIKDTEQLIKKWKSDNMTATQISKSVIVESILVSYYVSYCGQYQIKDRSALVQKIANDIVKLRLTDAVAKPILLIKNSLMKDAGVERSAKGPTYKMNLPEIHAFVAPRIPLVLDTNGIFEMNFHETFHLFNVEVISLYNTDFDTFIADAIEHGKTVLVTDVDEQNDTLVRLCSMYTLRNDPSSLKTITILGKGVKWNPGTRIFLTTNKRRIEDVPLSLRCRTTIIDACDETEKVIRKLIETKLVAAFDANNLKVFSQSQVTNSFLRTSNISSEEALIETYAQLAEILKDRGFLEAINDSIIKTVDTYKSRLASANKELAEIAEIKDNVRDITSQYNSLIAFIDIYWVAIKQSLEKLDDIHSFTFQSYLAILTKVLKTPGIQRDAYVEEMSKLINDTLSKQVLSWLQPMFSEREIVIYMFIVSYYFSIYHGKSDTSDMNNIFKVINELRKAPFDSASSEPLGDPISLLTTNASTTNIFKLVSRAITVRFGNDFFNQLSVFQPESVLMQTPNTPCLIISPPGKSPIVPIMQYISTRSKNDTIENISISNDALIIKRAKKMITYSISRGIRLLVHCSEETPEIISFIADICKAIQASTVNSNFRIIFSLSGFKRLPRFVLEMSKRLYYDDVIFSMKHSMNMFFPGIVSSIKMYSSTIPQMKKVAYALALALSIIMQRKLVIPVGFDENFIFNENTFQEAMTRIKSVVDIGKDIPVYAIRDIIINCILTPQIASPIDQRKIKAFITKMFTTSLTSDDYFFVADDNEPANACLKFPEEMQVASLAQAINIFPMLVPIPGLQIDKSIADPLRNWTLSRWMMDGISSIQATETKESTSEELITEAKKLCWLLPNVVPLPASAIAKTAIESVMRNEIITFDDLLFDMKETLTSTLLSQDLIDFVHQKVPDEWAAKVSYCQGGTSEDFITFLSKKHTLLNEWASTRSVSRIDLRYIKNATGLLNAYHHDIAVRKGIPIEKSMLYFDLKNEKDGYEMVLVNLKLVGAHVSEYKNLLEIKHTTSAISKFQNLTVRVIKKTTFPTKLFPVPLLREPLPHRENLCLTDGNMNNIIYMVPLPSDLNQAILTENGVALLTQTPSCLTPP